MDLPLTRESHMGLHSHHGDAGEQTGTPSFSQLKLIITTTTIKTTVRKQINSEVINQTVIH